VISLGVAAADWVGLVHPEITPPSNFHHLRDTTHWAEESVTGLNRIVFINVMYWIEVALSFFVPSTSGLAVLSMPILAPVGDFAGVECSLIVTAFQSAAGIVNLVTPTSAVVMGGLAIARVRYQRWLRVVWPVLLGLTIIIMAAPLASA